MSSKVDYKSAGVDIEAGNEAVRRIKSHVAETHKQHASAVLTGLGSFGALFALGDALKGLKDPVMVQSTDGVGTKSKVTVMAGRYEDLGRDLVAAVAGDIVVMGATPLTFLDYLGFHKTEPEIVEALVRGMSAACIEAGIALVGGETAEMPAVYAEGDLDVVGFVTGVVDRKRMLTGANIVAGDVLYAINSSGLHTNGFSLARKLIFEIGGYAIDARPEELDGKVDSGCAARAPYKLCYAGEEHSRRRDSGEGHGAHHRRRTGGECAAHIAGWLRRRDRSRDLDAAAYLCADAAAGKY